MLKSLKRFVGSVMELAETAKTASPAAVKLTLKRIQDESGDCDTVNATANEEPVRKKSRKRVRYAMLLAYQGKNYFGMQFQKDARTVEGCLFDAMHKYGIINDDELKRPNAFYFQRAARTDRSVSAVRQVCSMMLDLNESLSLEGPSALNALLPVDIRVIGIRRATPTFHAQKSCDSRTYSYTLPTYAFAKLDELTTTSYRIDDQSINEINELLSIFIGTHNFFNYTAKREANDRSCIRYIMEFKCGEKRLYKDDFTGQETEFLTILIRGQSFMLHQIRKMIGMVIAVMRGFLYKSDIQRSFDAARMDVPKAPGLGLLLEKLHYANYDRKFAKTHETLDYWGEEIEGKIESVRRELIMPEIFRQEMRTHSMMLWLTDIPKHEFPSLPENEVPADNRLSKASFTAKEAVSEQSNAEEILETEYSTDRSGTEPEKDETPGKKECSETSKTEKTF